MRHYFGLGYLPRCSVIEIGLSLYASVSLLYIFRVAWYSGLPPFYSIVTKTINSCRLHNIDLGWIPRNFKILILKPKWSFLRKNHKNFNSDEFPQFCEFTPYMIFSIFDVNSHHFQKIREIYPKDEFVKIREFTLVIIFMTFPSKMSI